MTFLQLLFLCPLAEPAFASGISILSQSMKLINEAPLCKQVLLIKLLLMGGLLVPCKLIYCHTGRNKGLIHHCFFIDQHDSLTLWTNTAAKFYSLLNWSKCYYLSNICNRSLKNKGNILNGAHMRQ